MRLTGNTCTAFFLAAAAALFYFLATPCQGQSLIIDANRQMAFGDQLFEDGQYRRASEEYQRFIFFFPESPKIREALYKSGLSLFKAGEWQGALKDFNRLTSGALGDMDGYARKAYFMTVETYLQAGTPTQAVVQLRNLIALSDQNETKDQAYYRLGWIYIDQGEWEQARKAYKRITAPSSFPLVELYEVLDKAETIPQKSPSLAGALSIVPGAGQLYCGRYQDALIAFLVNAGLILAAVDAYNQDQYALGGLLTFVGVGFYAGNIYGAVSDAHKYNQHQKQRFKDRLRWRINMGLKPSSIDGSGLVSPGPAVFAAIHFSF